MQKEPGAGRLAQARLAKGALAQAPGHPVARRRLVVAQQVVEVHILIFTSGASERRDVQAGHLAAAGYRAASQRRMLLAPSAHGVHSADISAAVFAHVHK